MAKYHLSNKAIEDLDAIWLYTLETWKNAVFNNYNN